MQIHVNKNIKSSLNNKTVLNSVVHMHRVGPKYCRTIKVSSVILFSNTQIHATSFIFQCFCLSTIHHQDITVSGQKETLGQSQFPFIIGQPQTYLWPSNRSLVSCSINVLLPFLFWVSLYALCSCNSCGYM